MSLKIIHLSDIHFRNGWEESLELVLNKLFDDIAKQLRLFGREDTYMVFSGDIVQAGDNNEEYESFIKLFSLRLDELGITKERRICVPGNHDVSIDWIEKNSVNHQGVLSLDFNEKSFNDYVRSDNCILLSKFDNYTIFEKEFCSFGLNPSLIGHGWSISEDIGVYCLNSSLLASGDSNFDEGNLCIDTRGIHEWIKASSHKIKILTMHHPISSLKEWAKKELENLLAANFNLLLTGHTHDQQVYSVTSAVGELTSILAPALFTRKENELGYCIVKISDKGVDSLIYRQWTKRYSFVSGVNFSNTDDGIISFNDKNGPEDSCSNNTSPLQQDIVWNSLKNNLENSLKSFSGQPSIWVDPELYSIDENKSRGESQKCDEKSKFSFNIKNYISTPTSIIISAEAQFGLTSLSHYICLKAWEDGKLWIRADVDELKAHEINDLLICQAAKFGGNVNDIGGIVIDSWRSTKENIKLYKKLIDLHPNIPVAILRSTVNSFFNVNNDNEVLSDREYRHIYLHSLPRPKIRQIVSQYNKQRDVGDDDIVLSKIVSDLDVLNLHRTPLNCITLLKVMEVAFDDSPVNRTEVIRRILFLLFNVDSLPTYKRRPDMKDCEHVLGNFCEALLRRNDIFFTRNFFMSDTTIFCKENFIDIETAVLFDLLYSNNIIIKSGNSFCFKFTYWVMFFAAQRMHHDNEFRCYILADTRYASYPELIEFYTGIDRQRNDALEVLLKDITATYSLVSDKLGFPDEIDPYSVAKWTPTDESVEKIRSELAGEVRASNLPDVIKDEFADRGYDPVRPYNQAIDNIVKEYCLELLTQVISASSRALRNSDFASSHLKSELLAKIIKSWELVTKVMVVLSPILAKEGAASFEGTRFVVVAEGDPSKLTEAQRFDCVFRCIPDNITGWFLEDLYSHKMGPLFYSKMSLSSNISKLSRHYLAITIAEKRPHHWKEKLQTYIADTHKNSFYLYHLASVLEREQVYSFTSHATQEDIRYLRKMTYAKHQYGAKKPGKKMLAKLDIEEDVAEEKTN